MTLSRSITSSLGSRPITIFGLLLGGALFASSGCSVNATPPADDDSGGKGGSGGSGGKAGSSGTGGTGGRMRGGGDPGPMTDQKSGSMATGRMMSAASQGGSLDGVVCDASLEGGAFCATDEDIIFCSAGSWWLLDCTVIDPAAFCGYDLTQNVVDCYVITDECLEDGEDCTDDTDCCSLVCGTDGTCGEDACSIDGEACLDDSDCCSLVCNIDGLCGEDECLYPEEACTDDLECCSGYCDPDYSICF